MSRSYKKRPFSAICKGRRDSEKSDKRLANRRLRAAFRQAMYRDPECSVPPLLREVSDVWGFSGDGPKGWFGDVKYPEWNEITQSWREWSGPAYYKKRMRK